MKSPTAPRARLNSCPGNMRAKWRRRADFHEADCGSVEDFVGEDALGGCLVGRIEGRGTLGGGDILLRIGRGRFRPLGSRGARLRS